MASFSNDTAKSRGEQNVQLLPFACQVRDHTAVPRAGGYQVVNCGPSERKIRAAQCWQATASTTRCPKSKYEIMGGVVWRHIRSSLVCIHTGTFSDSGCQSQVVNTTNQALSSNQSSRFSCVFVVGVSRSSCVLKL